MNQDRVKVNQTRVSVIVPTFNRARYLGECIDSLLAQTIQAFEILVVDDGSEDETAERVAAYGDRVRYVCKENGGKPSALNFGIPLTHGEFLWILDDDDVALPHAIEQRLETFNDYPEAGFVYSPHYLGKNGLDHTIIAYKLIRPPIYEIHEFFYKIMEDCFFHLSSALVRRCCYDQVGEFDTTLLSGEDYDMQIRLARIAVPAFCSEPSFIFRQHVGVRGAKSIRYHFSERDRVFRQYSQVLGQKYRTTVSLGEYLAPPKLGSLTLAEERRARSNRMRVMGNFGCAPEMIEDLRGAVSLFLPDERLDRETQQQIIKAMSNSYIYDSLISNWNDLIPTINGFRASPIGRSVIVALAFGVFRLARYDHGNLLSRLSKLQVAFRLLIKSHLV
ncbi:glycosyltransferase family A protein [Thiocystis violacea]|uniref:glycosyltransferase family A protein n=1 Tax=Thiocystis violacea TaxID=13725 RepID=UPI001A916099|nr:glycosyltransferase family A protein [Thiocystis violacea]MBK1724687.1 hypothetical protein [Thiocystis violacea]